MISNTSGDVFGYLLGNLQVKNIQNYLELVFDLKLGYRFKPQIVLHFSYLELLDYLVEFLNASVVDGIKRKIEVFDDKNPTSWKTLEKSRELKSVNRDIREPLILERPFFSDLNLIVTKNNRANVVESSFGKLKSVQGYFNSYRTPNGEVIRSKNKLFLRWQNFDSFRLASSQSKNLLGVSYKGEYIASNQFITHDIGLKNIKLNEIDFFTIKINKRATDIKPQEITNIEINLDTQQLILTRGILDDEFHIARFNKIRLFKSDKSVLIHKIIPFDKGSLDFEKIQTFFGTRYTEFEKAQQILTARGELGLLSTRNVVSGDLTAHIALSCMNLLGILPFSSPCLGFSHEDINDYERTSELFKIWIKELQDIFIEILDVSNSPDFTEHNVARLSKNIRAFAKLEITSNVGPDTFEPLITELEALTQYMDDFFKLSVYKNLDENLECETTPKSDEENCAEKLSMNEDELRLDDKTKDFVSENFSFFKKRDLLQKASLKIEKIMFYNNNIKQFSENRDFHPDLITYSNNQSQIENYNFASYPALSLTSVFDSTVFKSKDEIEELLFLRFMRDFTQRTFDKANVLGKSFHHQYKHTLAELGFLVDEKLQHLKKELEFLETPEHKEKAYAQLLEKITGLFEEHLKSKENNIILLEKEQKSIQNRLNKYLNDLEKLLDETIKADGLEEFLKSMPDRLEISKKEIIEKHKTRLTEISPIFNSYYKLHVASSKYFQKVLKYADLFQKALLMHRQRQMFEKAIKMSEPLFSMDKSLLEAKLLEFESFRHDENKQNQAQKEISKLSQQLEESLSELQKIPIKGLFKSEITESENLYRFIEFYKDEAFRLTVLIGKLRPIYQLLNKVQNLLFKKQEELISSKIEHEENELRIKIVRMILEDPNCKPEIEQLQKQSENIPKEIKDELGSLRSVLVEALNNFVSVTSKENLEKIINYKDFVFQAKRRDKINEITKELVNFVQGIKAVKKEREGEIKDLEYLRSQEKNLESVAMSKALPSTRVLLKTQYIPLVEKEKNMLNRANQFLAEIISNEKQITEAMTSTFFRKRYGVSQFAVGSYCLDTTAGTKDHTDKNIYGAYLQFSERHSKACSPAKKVTNKIGLKKLEVLGVEGLRNRISQIWHGQADDRFLCLPPSLSLVEALGLCEYKDMITRNKTKNRQSANSLILIYIHNFDFMKIKSDPEILEKYHSAILSNVFINIDNTQVFNNRESIYEACVRETFGQCNDKIASQIFQNLISASS
ncbi:hypothetical protein KKA14_05305, partial [bacterium]|nr:hypothetical protein [bacterium]